MAVGPGRAPERSQRAGTNTPSASPSHPAGPDRAASPCARASASAYRLMAVESAGHLAAERTDRHGPGFEPLDRIGRGGNGSRLATGGRRHVEVEVTADFEHDAGADRTLVDREAGHERVVGDHV